MAQLFLFVNLHSYIHIYYLQNENKLLSTRCFQESREVLYCFSLQIFHLAYRYLQIENKMLKTKCTCCKTFWVYSYKWITVCWATNIIMLNHFIRFEAYITYSKTPKLSFLFSIRIHTSNSNSRTRRYKLSNRECWLNFIWQRLVIILTCLLEWWYLWPWPLFSRTKSLAHVTLEL